MKKVKQWGGAEQAAFAFEVGAGDVRERGDRDVRSNRCRMAFDRSIPGIIRSTSLCGYAKARPISAVSSPTESSRSPSVSPTRAASIMSIFASRTTRSRATTRTWWPKRATASDSRAAFKASRCASRGASIGRSSAAVRCSRSATTLAPCAPRARCATPSPTCCSTSVVTYKRNAGALYPLGISTPAATASNGSSTPLSNPD